MLEYEQFIKQILLELPFNNLNIISSLDFQ